MAGDTNSKEVWTEKGQIDEKPLRRDSFRAYIYQTDFLTPSLRVMGESLPMYNMPTTTWQQQQQQQHKR